MGTRGLKAPLSPSEEVTLRRLLLGITETDDLPLRSLKRLRLLGLIDERAHLTPIGRERYESLPRPRPTTVDVSQKLLAFLPAMHNAGRRHG